MVFSNLTALHWAITSSNTNAVPPLLKSGASLDATNGKGQTPSDLADERKNNYIRHKIKEENMKRGVGSPGFLKSILSDRVSFYVIFKVMHTDTVCYGQFFYYLFRHLFRLYIL